MQVATTSGMTPNRMKTKSPGSRHHSMSRTRPWIDIRLRTVVPQALPSHPKRLWQRPGTIGYNRYWLFISTAWILRSQSVCA